MRIVNISDKVNDFDLTEVNGVYFNGIMNNCRDGVLQFEPHEQSTIDHFMKNVGVFSYDDTSMMTGFFVRSYEYTLIGNKGFVGFAEFCFTGTADRIDLL